MRPPALRTPRKSPRRPAPAPVAPASEPEPRILALLASIPRGCVTTYGALAERAGLPRRARLVAKVLSRLPEDSPLPWQRVVAAGGRIALPEGSPARREQLARLAAEGVVLHAGRVDLERCGWGAAGLDRLLWGPADET